MLTLVKGLDYMEQRHPEKSEMLMEAFLDAARSDNPDAVLQDRDFIPMGVMGGEFEKWTLISTSLSERDARGEPMYTPLCRTEDKKIICIQKEMAEFEEYEHPSDVYALNDSYVNNDDGTCTLFYESNGQIDKCINEYFRIPKGKYEWTTGKSKGSDWGSSKYGGHYE